MSKKYLSLEEAAESLGTTTEELIRLREKGEIRGFADRGTWKFKQEDVEEYGRSKNPDSSPDVPLLDSVLDEDVGEQPTVIRRSSGKEPVASGTSDSDVRLILDSDLSAESASDADVAMPSMADSDSDVRLTDESPAKRAASGRSDSGVKSLGSDSGSSDSDVKFVGADSDSDVKFVGADSDSDVRLVAETQLLAGIPADSDSDVKMVPDSDSDVKMVADSDSDVKMVTDSDLPLVGRSSDSDVQMLTDSDITQIGAGSDSDSDVHLVSDAGTPTAGSDSDSDVRLMSDTQAMPPQKAPPKRDGKGGQFSKDEADSGISIDLASGSEASVLSDESDSGFTEDSGLTMRSDSGISLDSLSDSGISLEAEDSGISLAGSEDSGIALDSTGSGIEVGRADDSGLTLEDDSGSYALAADSGISLDRDSDSGIRLDATDELSGTVPMVDSAELDNQLDATQMEVPALDSEAEGTDTSVILFDDEEDVDDYSATAVRKGAKGGAPASAGDTFDLAEEEFGSDDLGGDLEIAEDVIGEDDELEDLDVFDAADEDFDESFETGESAAEFIAPGPVGRVAVPAETEWGGPTLAGLAVSTVLLAVCGMVTFDLVRSIWYWHDPTPFNSFLLEKVSGLFS